MYRPFILVGVVLFSWGLSEYLLVLTGKKLNWQSGMFYNCVGVVTFNVASVAMTPVDLSVDRWVVAATLTGVLYGLGDVFFLKLSGSGEQNLEEGGQKLGHLADASVLAPLCSLYILIPTGLGVFIDGEQIDKREWHCDLCAQRASSARDLPD